MDKIEWITTWCAIDWVDAQDPTLLYNRTLIMESTVLLLLLVEVLLLKGTEWLRLVVFARVLWMLNPPTHERYALYKGGWDPHTKTTAVRVGVEGFTESVHNSQHPSVSYCLISDVVSPRAIVRKTITRNVERKGNMLLGAELVIYVCILSYSSV